MQKGQLFTSENPFHRIVLNGFSNWSHTEMFNFSHNSHITHISHSSLITHISGISHIPISSISTISAK